MNKERKAIMIRFFIVFCFWFMRSIQILGPHLLNSVKNVGVTKI